LAPAFDQQPRLIGTMRISKPCAAPRFIASGFFVAGAIALAGPAAAEGFGGRPAGHCARYGADFVAIAGSDACVRVVGHVRVDIARGPVAPLGYAAPQDGVRPAAATSHVRGGDPAAGLLELFPR
jgi:hypothetical protein